MFPGEQFQGSDPLASFVSSSASFADAKSLRPREWNWSVLASLIAHVVLGSILLTFTLKGRTLVPPDIEAITVEMVSPQQEDPARQRSPNPEFALPRPGTRTLQPGEAKAEAEGPPPTGKREVEPAAMIAASELYAAKVLEAPKSRKVRKALRDMATEERMIQLCNMEAMEQVRRWDKTFQPDYLVAYAMSDPKMTATAVDAYGGAFRSKRHWYNIGFKCAVTLDIAKIVSFAFSVGAEIPKTEWRAHNLAPDDGPND